MRETSFPVATFHTRAAPIFTSYEHILTVWTEYDWRINSLQVLCGATFLPRREFPIHRATPSELTATTYLPVGGGLISMKVFDLSALMTDILFLWRLPIGKQFLPQATVIKTFRNYYLPSGVNGDSLCMVTRTIMR